MGDAIFQILLFVFLIFFLSLFVIIIKTISSKRNTNHLEEKLDRIIELLEKDINN